MIPNFQFILGVRRASVLNKPRAHILPILFLYTINRVEYLEEQSRLQNLVFMSMAFGINPNQYGL